MAWWLNKIRPALISWGAVFFCILHLYTAVYGAPESKLLLTVHLTVAMVLAFMIKPLGSGIITRLIDLVLCAMAFGILAYMLFNFEQWDLRVISLGFWDYVTGIMLILLIFESVRRTVGLALILMALFFILQALFANYFPGVFYGAPTSFESLLSALYIGNAGIYGVPLAVVAHYVVLFIIFGEALSVCGAGAFMTRLAFALFGHRTGGPAKAAVIGSGMMGSISGSCIGNVLTTGAFTIPMMKKLGYRSDFAGGVEATASTGGMLLPPVMGVTAFMMADFMGVPYVKVVLAAMIPAVLYYWGVYWSVHFEAKRAHLDTIPRCELPDPRQLMKRQGYLAIPLITLVIMLFLGWSILIVALAGILAVCLLSFVRKSTRLTPMRVNAIFQRTAKSTVPLSAACACAGIIIAAIFSTGLSFELSQMAIGAGGSHLWLILLLTAIMAMVLGMGITSSAVYITMVATVIPILKLAGIPEMAAHMFSMYYGVLSNITPPVALAAFAASSIAGSNPMATGLQATRIGIAGFVVPFLFVYAPELLLIGSFKVTIWVTFTAALGLLCLAAGFTGFLINSLFSWQRILLLATAVLMIKPDIVTDLLGLSLMLIVVLSNLLLSGKPIAWKKTETQKAADDIKESIGEAANSIEKTNNAVPAANRLMQEEILPGGEDEVTRFSLYCGWALLAGVVFFIGLLGENSVHATSAFWWLASLAVLSLCVAAGLKLILKPANERKNHQFGMQPTRGD